MREFIDIIDQTDEPIIAEGFVTTLTPDYGARKPFDVFKNPSRKEWREIAGQHDEVRAYIVGDDVFAWPVFGDLHANVARALGITNGISVLIMGDYRGEASIQVTDATRHTSWLHNPGTADAIRDCAFLDRTFEFIEIGFFDETVVGDWSELSGDED